MKHNFHEKVNRRGIDCYKWNTEFGDIEYPMGCADTDFKVAQPILDVMKSKMEQGVLAYGSGSLKKFALAISSYFNRHHGFDIEPDHIRFAPGLLLALKMFCDAYTRPGDYVIIQPPVYHAFRATIELAGRHVLDNPLVYDEAAKRYSIDFEDLEEKAKNPRARMMVLCNPANPTCTAFTKDELLKVFEICYRNNVLVISDEVHSDMYFGDHKHVPFLSISEEAKQNAIIMSAGGKTFNIHSLYTSFVTIPNNYLREQYNLTYKYHHFDYNWLGVVGTTAAYSECDYYVDGMIEYVWGNIKYLQEYLKNELPSVSMIDPQATYLMWLDFRKWNMTSLEAQELLIEYGVGLSNGSNFGPGGEGFLRMNVACHRDVLEGALSAIKRAYDEKVKL